LDRFIFIRSLNRQPGGKKLQIPLSSRQAIWLGSKARGGKIVDYLTDEQRSYRGKSPVGLGSGFAQGPFPLDRALGGGLILHQIGAIPRANSLLLLPQVFFIGIEVAKGNNGNQPQNQGFFERPAVLNGTQGQEKDVQHKQKPMHRAKITYKKGLPPHVFQGHGNEKENQKRQTFGQCKQAKSP
jgi:hypothetical protein